MRQWIKCVRNRYDAGALRAFPSGFDLDHFRWCKHSNHDCLLFLCCWLSFWHFQRDGFSPDSQAQFLVRIISTGKTRTSAFETLPNKLVLNIRHSAYFRCKKMEHIIRLKYSTCSDKILSIHLAKIYVALQFYYFELCQVLKHACSLCVHYEISFVLMGEPWHNCQLAFSMQYFFDKQSINIPMLAQLMDKCQAGNK